MFGTARRSLWPLYVRTLARLYVDTNTDYRNSVLLSSAGRSGSTFVSDIINFRNDYRIIFEPFNSELVPLAEPFVFPTYVDPDDVDPALVGPLDRIVSGRIRTVWTDGQNRKLWAGKRLIKAIRANLMLEWIHRRYPEMPIVLLLRNPFAVIESATRVGWRPEKVRSRILQQEPQLHPLLPEGVFEEYKRTRSEKSIHLFHWCITHYLPLKRLPTSEICVVFYEDFVLRPREAIGAVFRFLRMRFCEEALRSVQRPSFMTSADSPLLQGESTLRAWKRSYRADEIAEGQRILALFHLDTLYDFSREGIPDRDALNALAGQECSRPCGETRVTEML
jgi:hypothetical protein